RAPRRRRTVARAARGAPRRPARGRGAPAAATGRAHAAPVPRPRLRRDRRRARRQRGRRARQRVPGAQEAACGARRCTTMITHDDELIALLLGDRRRSAALGRWLGTLEGRRELAAYRRTLEALAALYGDAAAAPRRTIYYCALPTPIGRVFVAAGEAGQVVSYGEIARRIGQPHGSRAVGQALRHNPVPIVIPCHRVIAAGGRIGGYTGGLGIKRKLLRLEGALAAAG